MTPRVLRPPDIEGAMRLKEAAGWNQTPRDWANLLALEPEGCFGIEIDGTLAATATAICYGRDLAWIGMVLTAPEFRGRGFARLLMQHALRFLEERQVAWIKLDATDMGRPLYLQLGFEDECLVERWHRSGSAAKAAPGMPLGFDAALDREAFGADRTRMLGLASVESAEIPGCGFAMGRPGTRAAYFGPCVSRSAEGARTLLDWFLALHPREDVFWDLLPGNSEAVRLAREFGFEPRRKLVRMARPGTPRPPRFAHNDSYVFAIAGLEFG
jgi:GNAT superfamily N-acetyltransferase